MPVFKSDSGRGRAQVDEDGTEVCPIDLIGAPRSVVVDSSSEDDIPLAQLSAKRKRIKIAHANAESRTHRTRDPSPDVLSSDHLDSKIYADKARSSNGGAKAKRTSGGSPSAVSNKKAKGKGKDAKGMDKKAKGMDKDAKGMDKDAMGMGKDAKGKISQKSQKAKASHEDKSSTDTGVKPLEMRRAQIQTQLKVGIPARRSNQQVCENTIPFEVKDAQNGVPPWPGRPHNLPQQLDKLCDMLSEVLTNDDIDFLAIV